MPACGGQAAGNCLGRGTQAILSEQLGETLWSADTNIGKAFGRMLAGKKVQNWLGMIPRAFDTRYFEANEEKLEAMIAKLEKRYR